MFRFRPYLVFISCIVFMLGVAVTLQYLTADDLATWFSQLRKPRFSPPSDILSPVWTGLFGLMGISLFLIWMSPENREQRVSKFAFFEQLIVNAGWWMLLYEYRQLGWSFIILALLWLLVLRMVLQFRYVHYLATLLQMPYLAWLSYQLVLYATIWWLNSGFAAN